ncbi:MAG: DUF2802 domain-containing protein [Rhodanobacter sp.]
MWPELAIGLSLVLLLQSIALIGGWRCLRKLQLDMYTLVSNGSAPRVDTHLVRPGRIGKQPTKVELPSPQLPMGVSYELARKLAREGADIEQLTSRCGLAHDEAALLLQLHRRAS